VSEQLGARYRVAREPDGVHVLRLDAREQERDLYAFTRVPALPVDFEVAHHFTSTHPRSPFVNGLTVQRTTRERRRVLRGRSYFETDGATEVRRELSDREVVALLPEAFGLDVPAEDVLEALGS